jgi:hypothetical protein
MKNSTANYHYQILTTVPGINLQHLIKKKNLTDTKSRLNVKIEHFQLLDQFVTFKIGNM